MDGGKAGGSAGIARVQRCQQHQVYLLPLELGPGLQVGQEVQARIHQAGGVVQWRAHQQVHIAATGQVIDA